LIVSSKLDHVNPSWVILKHFLTLAFILFKAGGDLAHPNNNQRLNEMRGMYEAKIVSLEEQVNVVIF
jgi:hypothetical protein